MPLVVSILQHMASTIVLMSLLYFFFLIYQSTLHYLIYKLYFIITWFFADVWKSDTSVTNERTIFQYNLPVEIRKLDQHVNK